MRREMLARAAAAYAAAATRDDGRLAATFDVIVLTGWAPAPGQPQPLRPGSAATRLEAALRAAGEAVRRSDLPTLDWRGLGSATPVPKEPLR